MTLELYDSSLFSDALSAFVIAWLAGITLFIGYLVSNMILGIPFPERGQQLTKTQNFLRIATITIFSVMAMAIAYVFFLLFTTLVPGADEHRHVTVGDEEISYRGTSEDLKDAIIRRSDSVEQLPDESYSIDGRTIYPEECILVADSKDGSRRNIVLECLLPDGTTVSSAEQVAEDSDDEA